MKKICFLLILGLALVAGRSFATVYTGSVGPELTYTLDSGTGHVVIEGRGAMTSDDLSNYPKREYVKTVSFPEGLTSICANAFHGCYNLQSIVLPDSVTTIGAYAFQECTKMTSADLGKGIKTINSQAFIFCSNLQKVRWSDCLESIGDMAFYNCTNLGDTVFFPKTFKTMGSEAFGSENYNSASKVMVWEAIHANDFVRYESDVPGECHFSYIIFGDSVEYIPNMLCKFMYNDSITLPETVKEIGAEAFANCNRLQKINIPEGVTSIGASAFAGCKKLKQLILPAGLKEIPEQLCNLCLALDSVKLPAGLTVIPQKAFTGCALRRVAIPNSVTNIGNIAFAGCPLDTLVLPSALNVLGDDVFNQLNLTTSPKHLVFNDKLVATGMGTFCNWSELQTIVIGKNVAILGQDCFMADSLVTDITCYASQPPLIYDATFDGVPDTATVHVLSGSVAAYRSAQYWSRFRIVALDGEEIIQRSVTVDPGTTTADFTWPTDSDANSYQIDIYKDGAVFCKLTLGNRGQLLGISFSAPRVRTPSDSPTRGEKGKKLEANESLPYTLSFKVTGLDEASRYTYVLSVLDENNAPLHVYVGDFATLGYSGELQYDGNELIPTPPIIPGDPDAQSVVTGIEKITDEIEGFEPFEGKILLNGQLLIRRKGETYNILGQKVN